MAVTAVKFISILVVLNRLFKTKFRWRQTPTEVHKHSISIQFRTIQKFAGGERPTEAHKHSMSIQFSYDFFFAECWPRPTEVHKHSISISIQIFAGGRSPRRYTNNLFKNRVNRLFKTASVH